MQDLSTKLRGKARRMNYLLSQLASPFKLGRYLNDYRNFKRMGGTVVKSYPVLQDYSAQAGSGSGQYFHQDLLVATLINQRSPVRHIDIGSRIDGFVAHVAAFRKIEVMDVRDLDDTGHPNISFVKANLMNSAGIERDMSDSISCLHAIEHFGLGRYGDPLDPEGHLKGFRNMLSMLKVDGILYISFPIGMKNGVYFNAHRVFDPAEIYQWLPSDGSYRIERFDYVNDDGRLVKDLELPVRNVSVVDGCGIYSVRRVK
jgi:hypothetical protein